MKIFHPAIAVILASAMQVHAAAPSAAIVLECPVEHAPSLQAVAALLGTTTFQSTYNARDRVLHLARQACRRGALAVRVVAGDDPDTALVQRDALDLARGLPVR
jgi:hypothetical protein